MDDKTIYIKEKENPPRIKEEYSTLTIKVRPHDPNVIMSEQVKRGASIKFAKPLVEKIEGPFDENDNIVEELEVGKTYIYKATKFKQSTFTPIKHIWFAEQLNDGEITDLEYKKEENPYLDEQGTVCFKYVVKECEKVRIYAYVAKPIKSVSIENPVLFDDDYIKAIRNGRIIYTCNSGWIDKTHAFTDTKRPEPYIGVKNLWSQILNETGTKSNSPNEEGFKVIYKQDSTVIQNTPIINKPLRAGKTKEYFVKTGLTLEEKKQVALAIFKEVSIEFEGFQSLGFIIGKGHSSFEPADLISNLISFYRIVNPELNEEKILKLSKELTIEESIEVYRKYPGTFTEEKYKNRKFHPKYFPNKHCNNPKFPKELQTIKDIKKGIKFRDWITLFDIHGGKPPITGSKS
ncbi:MAG: hypothetical protein CSA40_01890 [Flavobacteriales bacterium]|nr:MAG: hypothetical protein CSA40_01890 [Flavobacteriales bacterium]